MSVQAITDRVKYDAGRGPVKTQNRETCCLQKLRYFGKLSYRHTNERTKYSLQYLCLSYTDIFNDRTVTNIVIPHHSPL
jgi:hypothetical protein